MKSKLLPLVEGALMIALATILSYVKFLDLPFGGSVTLEMVPLVVMGFRHGPKWGIGTGFVHGLLQMIIGFSNVLYCANLISQIGCILLDYILAFSACGLGAVLEFGYKKNKVVGAIVGSFLVGLIRFLCSFLSGVLIWGSYAPEGMNVWVYSLIYNGSYMVLDTIIVIVVMAILAGTVPKILINQSNN